MSGFKLPELPSNNKPRIWYLKKKAKEQPALYSWLYDPSGSNSTKVMMQQEDDLSDVSSDHDDDDEEQPFNTKWSKFGNLDTTTSLNDSTLITSTNPNTTLNEMDIDDNNDDNNGDNDDITAVDQVD